MDPFHVVQWMNDALDGVRREEWNTARAAAKAARPRPKGKRGRPAKGELPPDKVKALEDEAASIKGSRYALVKNPEDLTDGQRAKLEALKRRAGSRLVRAWELKEDLRAVFRAGSAGQAAELLDDWMHRAAYCKIAKVVAAEKKVRRRRARHRQREGRGHQQQDQGDGEDGLRLPQHRQPRGPAHAQVR